MLFLSVKFAAANLKSRELSKANFAKAIFKNLALGKLEILKPAVKFKGGKICTKSNLLATPGSVNLTAILAVLAAFMGFLFNLKTAAKLSASRINLILTAPANSLISPQILSVCS
ncbi:MAG: hypothetical protein ACFNTA_09930 [Campylobacter sp.]|uniref:hypothetical protein n=1 Tax=Campylobacter sp. TaxID=205 RepID=UPI00361643D2